MYTYIYICVCVLSFSWSHESLGIFSPIRLEPAPDPTLDGAANAAHPTRAAGATWRAAGMRGTGEPCAGEDSPLGEKHGGMLVGFTLW